MWKQTPGVKEILWSFSVGGTQVLCVFLLLKQLKHWVLGWDLVLKFYGYVLNIEQGIWNICHGGTCLGNKQNSCYLPLLAMFYRRRQRHPTPVVLPGKSQERRSLVGYSPWGREESDTTERLHFQFSLSCIGEGNGNPLQCSCLENPRDGGAWWAAVYGVTQSRTRLKRLSSSNCSQIFNALPHLQEK